MLVIKKGKEFVEQLSKHEFLLAKPSDKEIVEKINIERD